MGGYHDNRAGKACPLFLFQMEPSMVSWQAITISIVLWLLIVLAIYGAFQ